MPTKNNKIHFIITGGTIDSYYDGTKDTACPNEQSIVPNYLKLIKLYDEISHTIVCLKDSREITSKDRQKILRVIQNCKTKKIIITHGTYTLPDTARYLNAHLKNNKKTIIFVCSMIPLVGFTPTDAGFNLGYAFAKAQELPAGIYVCMNGKVFTPEEVIKILSEARFSSIYTK